MVSATKTTEIWYFALARILLLFSDSDTFLILGTDSASYSSYFSIDGLQGVIKTAQQLDREGSNDVYVLNVVATDSGSSSVTGTMTVTINDLNDNKPECTPNTYYVDVDENTASGKPLIMLCKYSLVFGETKYPHGSGYFLLQGQQW